MAFVEKDRERFFVKEHHLTLYYEFLDELDRIPDSNSKLEYLRKHLYRTQNITPFRVISKYFLDRIVYGEAPTIRILPLHIEEVSKKTFLTLNMPQIDLVISKGISLNKFRQRIEDWIYSNKGIVQRFLCDFANAENIYKIPKSDLQKLIENQRLRLDKCKVSDLQTLSEYYVGFNEKYLTNMKYIPKEWLEKNSHKISTLPSVKLVDFWRRLYWRRYFRRRKGIIQARYKHYIENVVDVVYEYRFPAIVFNREEEKVPLYYFLKRGDMIKTNVQGLLAQWVFFMFGKIRDVLFVSYYKNDTFYPVICTLNKVAVRNAIENVNGNYTFTPTTLMADYNTLKKRIPALEQRYNVKAKFKISRKEGFPIMDMAHLLNYILVNKFHNKENLVIVMNNGVMVAPKVQVIPVVLTSYDARVKKVFVQTLDENAETIKVHINRVSDIPRVVGSFVNKKILLFRFDIGGDFLLLEAFRTFTWEEISYAKESKYRITYW